jgi:LysM repeat protein
LADLLWLNTLDEEAFLQPGDELIIRLAPGQSPPPTPTPKTTHIIQSGESAWAIAALYGLALDDLLAYNDLDRDSLLRPGNQLLLQPPATPTEQGPESESTLVVPETKRSTATATPAAVSQSGPLMIETPLSPQQAIPAEKVSTLEPTPSSVTKATGSGVSPFMLVVAVGFILLAVILAGAAYRER